MDPSSPRGDKGWPIQARYLSAKQAATYLGVSVFSVYRLVERRAIPFIPVYPSGTGGRSLKRPSIRFDVHALDAWMQKQAIKPAAEFIDGPPAKH